MMRTCGKHGQRGEHGQYTTRSYASVVRVGETNEGTVRGGVTSLRWTKAPVLGIRRSAGCSVPARAALRGGSPSRLPWLGLGLGLG